MNVAMILHKEILLAVKQHNIKIIKIRIDTSYLKLANTR